MLTIEAVANIDAEGMLTVKAPRPVPSGRHHVVIVIDEGPEVTGERHLSSLADFRASLGVVVHTGNAVIEGREEERE